MLIIQKTKSTVSDWNRILEYVEYLGDDRDILVKYDSRRFSTRYNYHWSNIWYIGFSFYQSLLKSKTDSTAIVCIEKITTNCCPNFESYLLMIKIYSRKMKRNLLLQKNQNFQCSTFSNILKLCSFNFYVLQFTNLENIKYELEFIFCYTLNVKLFRLYMKFPF